MADEAVLIYETSLPIPMTCADGAGIEKGTLLKLSDPYTVAATSADNDKFGGIAAEEKIASDGKTKIPVYRSGIFKIVVGAAGCTAGKDVVISAANRVVDYTTLDDETGAKFGKALETGTVGESVYVEVGS
jgi:hypothetical protein